MMNSEVKSIIRDAETRNKILDAIWAEQTATPGRAGETPVSRLACELSKLRGDTTTSVVRVFIQIIEHPPYGVNQTLLLNFWQCVTFLTQYIRRDESKTFVAKYRPYLIGQNHLDDDYRVHVLNAFLACGGTLTERELMEELFSLRASNPANWVSSAVDSGLFSFAEKQLKLLFEEGAVSMESARLLRIMFYSWKKKWPSVIDFDKIVEGFPPLIRN